MSGPLDHIDIFPWSERFETGIDLIDQQHRVLVGLLNRLALATVRGTEVEINGIFDELVAYASYHFETEEGIWAASLGEDARCQQHHRSHQGFLPAVQAIRTQQAEQPLPFIVESVIRFLIRWLAFHILDDDRRMAITALEVDAGFELAEARSRADQRMNDSCRAMMETLLGMYDGLSTNTFDLMREKTQRVEAEAALIEANRKLEQLATTDTLTGLFNRRHFDIIFPQEINRALREQQPLCLMLIDIDHFKRINDQYGHASGDLALKAVGQSLKGLSHRASDFCFRIGGEEFVVAAANLPENQAIQFAERIRHTLAGLIIPLAEHQTAIRMTVSIGLACGVPSPASTADAYLSMADKRLYRAKSGGRNRVMSEG